VRLWETVTTLTVMRALPREVDPTVCVWLWLCWQLVVAVAAVAVLAACCGYGSCGCVGSLLWLWQLWLCWQLVVAVAAVAVLAACCGCVAAADICWLLVWLWQLVWETVAACGNCDDSASTVATCGETSGTVSD
jgi:hypothetical protein